MSFENPSQPIPSAESKKPSVEKSPVEKMYDICTALLERLKERGYPYWGTKMSRDSVMSIFSGEFRKLDEYKKYETLDKKGAEKFLNDFAQNSWDDYRHWAQENKKAWGQ